LLAAGGCARSTVNFEADASTPAVGVFTASGIPLTGHQSRWRWSWHWRGRPDRRNTAHNTWGCGAKIQGFAVAQNTFQEAH